MNSSPIIEAMQNIQALLADAETYLASQDTFQDALDAIDQAAEEAARIENALTHSAVYN